MSIEPKAVNQRKSAARGTSRREFLKKSTLAGAAFTAGTNLFKTPVYGQTQAPAPGNVVGANNRIVVGYIGVGLQGGLHISLQKANAQQNNIAQAAVCDVSAHRRDAAMKAVDDDKAKPYENFEELLGRNDIDAVTISTCDQWHATAAIAALQAGKHVYLEKPMARYLPEAFDLYDTITKSGKVFQVGSQACSDPKWDRARQYVKDGKVGQLVLIQEAYMRNSKDGEWNTAPYVPADWMDEKDINWPKWQGKTKKIPFSSERFARWRKYYPYCAGPLGDLAPHRIHPVLLATGKPEFPSRVVCLGQNPVHADRTPPGAPDRDCPEDVQFIAEFPSGLALIMITGTVNQVGLDSVIRGHLGTLLVGANSVDLRPEPFADEIDPDTAGNLGTESIESHEKNWFDSIRANTPLAANAGADLAIKAQTVLSLAEMSNRLNMMCRFDEKTRKIIGADGKEVPAFTYGAQDNS